MHLAYSRATWLSSFKLVFVFFYCLASKPPEPDGQMKTIYIIKWKEIPNAKSHYIILRHVFFTSCPCYSSTMRDLILAEAVSYRHKRISNDQDSIREKIMEASVTQKLKTQLTVFAPTKRGRRKHKKQTNVLKETTTKQDGCHELELTWDKCASFPS